MNTALLARLFDEFTVSAFRLEQLQEYLAPEETEEFAAFTAGRPVPLRTVDTSPWLARIAADAAVGRRWSRVRVVERPLSPYTQFELREYQANVAAGEEIYLVDRSTHHALDGLREDFWLFDERTVVRLRYDDRGRFLGVEEAEGALLDRYRRWRDLALAHASPLLEQARGTSRRSA